MPSQVRGILNKLTPEKFEKLTVDILNAGLDSTTILKGVILLVSESIKVGQERGRKSSILAPILASLQIFEKALDEPKYSSMYAQLCKRLAEKAPNFDPQDNTCTFRRLLVRVFN